jgi:ribonuclease G
MANPKNRQLVEDALNRELARDRTKTYVVEISPLGLVEMTRQNVTDGPREILTIACPTCTGDGVIVSPETHAVEAERKLRQHIAGSKAEAFVVEMHSDVAAILIGPGGSRLVELEKETGRRYAFKTKKSFRLDRFQILTEGKETQIEGLAPKVEEKAKAKPRRGGKAPVAPIVLEDEFVDDGEPEEPLPKPKARPSRARAPKAAVTPGDAPEETPAADGDEPAEPKPKKKTRRGTRGGRGRKRKTAATATATAADGAAAAEPVAETNGRPAEPVPEPAAEGTEEAAAPSATTAEGDGAEKPKKKTRRGTRGGRKRKKKPAAPPEDGSTEPIATAEEAG